MRRPPRRPVQRALTEEWPTEWPPRQPLQRNVTTTTLIASSSPIRPLESPHPSGPTAARARPAHHRLLEKGAGHVGLRNIGGAPRPGAVHRAGGLRGPAGARPMSRRFEPICQPGPGVTFPAPVELVTTTAWGVGAWFASKGGCRGLTDIDPVSAECAVRHDIEGPQPGLMTRLETGVGACLPEGSQVRNSSLSTSRPSRPPAAERHANRSESAGHLSDKHPRILSFSIWIASAVALDRPRDPVATAVAWLG